jgi:hypothetical protein
MIVAMQPTHPNSKRRFRGVPKFYLKKELRKPYDGIWKIQLGVKRFSGRAMQAKDWVWESPRAL